MFLFLLDVKILTIIGLCFWLLYFEKVNEMKWIKIGNDFIIFHSKDWAQKKLIVYIVSVTVEN